MIQQIKEAKNAIIFLHRNPDADCVCSALALERFIKALNMYCNVLLLGDLKGKYKFVPGVEDIKINKDCSEFDLIFFVDTADFKDVSEKKFAEEVIKKSCLNDEKKIIIIDHHSKTKFNFSQFTNNISSVYAYPELTSTCEIIWNLIKEQFREKLWRAFFTDEDDLVKIFLFGIYSETGKLLKANHKTFLAISQIMNGTTLSFSEITEEFSGTPLKYELFYSKILEQWTEVMKGGLIIFEVPMSLLRDFFPRYINKDIFRREGYPMFLFPKFKDLRIGKVSSKSFPTGMLGIFPNKFDPNGKDKFLIYEANRNLNEDQVKKLKELQFECFRDNGTRFMKKLDINDVYDGKYKNLIGILDTL